MEHNRSISLQCPPAFTATIPLFQPQNPLMMSTVFLKSAMGNVLAECPFCGGPAGGATSISQEPRSGRPYPGALVVCTRCKAINQYDAQLLLEPATPQALAELKANKKLWAIVQHYQKGGARG